MAGFTVESPAFAAGKPIPRKFTCDGEDRSPAIQWTGAPHGTESFALICDDPDAPAGTFVHWVIYAIPGTATGLPEGVPALPTLPDRSKQGMNSWKKVGFGGPCPPLGKAHRYFFKVYALSEMLTLGPGATKQQLQGAMEGLILAHAELVGTYARA